MLNLDIYRIFLEKFLDKRIRNLFTEVTTSGSKVLSIESKEISIYLTLWDIYASLNPRISCSFDYRLLDNNYFEIFDEYIDEAHEIQFTSINNNLFALLNNKLIIKYLIYHKNILKKTIIYCYYLNGHISKGQVDTTKSLTLFLLKNKSKEISFEFGPWLMTTNII